MIGTARPDCADAGASLEPTKLTARPGGEAGASSEAGTTVASLREHKALTPREIWDGVGISKQGALDLLRPLIKAGLVRRIGTKKSGRYVLR
jgi:predicted HTH transcriptional regulator